MIHKLATVHSCFNITIPTVVCVYVCVCVVEVIIVSSRATQAGLKSKHKATTGIKAAIETNKQTRQKALTDIAGGQASRQTDKMANRSS